MVIYTAACEDCAFNFNSGCAFTTHTAAEQHAKGRGHEVIYGGAMRNVQLFLASIHHPSQAGSPEPATATPELPVGLPARRPGARDPLAHPE